MSRSGEPERGRSSHLPRRSTRDPLRFLIPTAALSPGFAERVAGPPGEPPRPQPAATVVLVRNGEVLLLRRPERSSFAAGHWVFPGGRVDAGDVALGALLAAGGGAGAEWARRLEVSDPAIALGFGVAALREAWEETGILLAEPRPPAERLRSARRELLRGGELGRLLEALRVRLSLGALVYVARWITPEAEMRRFDARFFLADVAPDTACELLGEELEEACWIPPAAAVEAAVDGDLPLLPPTLHTLRLLAALPSPARLREELGRAPVPTYLPRMLPHPDGVEVVVEEED